MKSLKLEFAMIWCLVKDKNLDTSLKKGVTRFCILYFT